MAPFGIINIILQYNYTLFHGDINNAMSFLPKLYSGLPEIFLVELESSAAKATTLKPVSKVHTIANERTKILDVDENIML